MVQCCLAEPLSVLEITSCYLTHSHTHSLTHSLTHREQNIKEERLDSSPFKGVFKCDGGHTQICFGIFMYAK